MKSVSEALKNIFRQIPSVVAAFYLLLGIKMDFSWERAKKNFDERKKLFKNTAGQVAVVIFFLLIVFFHFYVPGVSLLSTTAISLLLSSLALFFAVAPVLITEFVQDFLQASYYVRRSSSVLYLLSKTTFRPVFIPVPTSPPRFNLAA